MSKSVKKQSALHDEHHTDGFKPLLTMLSICLLVAVVLVLSVALKGKVLLGGHENVQKVGLNYVSDERQQAHVVDLLQDGDLFLADVMLEGETKHVSVQVGENLWNQLEGGRRVIVNVHSEWNVLRLLTDRNIEVVEVLPDVFDWREVAEKAVLD